MWFLGDKKDKKKEVSLEIQENHTADSHCFISGNVSISGEIQFSGTLRVDGRVEGKITPYPGKKGTLIVSKGAYIQGPIYVTHVICDGTIQGNVHAEDKLEVRTHGIIRGEMFYHKLSTSEGAQLIGKCHQRVDDSVKLKSVGSPSFSHSLATRDVSTLSKKKSK